jgi:hypothetical protein
MDPGGWLRRLGLGGIATGMVVVGDLIGSGSAQEQTIVGETPNLAAPQRERERLFEALLNEIEGLSRRRPVLAMFEDALRLARRQASVHLPVGLCVARPASALIKRL